MVRRQPLGQRIQIGHERSLLHQAAILRLRAAHTNAEVDIPPVGKIVVVVDLERVKIDPADASSSRTDEPLRLDVALPDQ